MDSNGGVSFKIVYIDGILDRNPGPNRRLVFINAITA